MSALDDILKALLGGAGLPPNTPVGGSVSIPLGSGYTVPQPPVGEQTSRDIAHCNPELQRRYALVKTDYENENGRQLFITRTWSAPEYNFKLFKQGRRLRDLSADSTDPDNWIPIDPVGHSGIVTNCDGFRKRSRHNVFPAEALDVCVDTDPGPGKHIVWDHASYKPLGALAQRHGLVWGGSWKSIHDDPHLELPAGAV